MFFDHLVKKKQVQLAAPPPIPDNGWRPLPTSEWPDLRRASWIGFDVETYDPNLLTKGPGWARHEGYIVGISLASDWGSLYLPIRHATQSNLNLDATQVLSYVKDVLETPNVPKVGANLLYDVGWLTEENIFVEGDLHDIQFAEALLTESGGTSLEYLGIKYVGEGKESSDLYNWLSSYCGGKPNSDQRGNIWRAPPSLVGPYAERDASLPMDILQQQWQELEKQDLLNVYRLECDLIYPLVQMRMAGVSVNLPYVEQLKVEFDGTAERLNNELADYCGIRVNVHSNNDLAKLFDQGGIKYPKTELGNPSFVKEFLDECEHPIADKIKEIRKFDILRNTFLQGYLLESNVNGKVYCQFHPLRGTDGGTRSGRFASSDPNLQNIPIRTDEGKKIRACFVPDDGHECWEKVDYSQIEYRFLAHYAVGRGSDVLRTRYNDDPNIDYHDNTYREVCPVMGWDVDDAENAKFRRRPIKNINFGLIYGMGKPKLKRSLMLYFQGKASDDEVEALFKAYHEANPYVKATMDATSREANMLGYITTILGRRSRFELWQPIYGGDRGMALPYHLAVRQWGNGIKRAFLHKAINRRLQGSAADLMKVAMWKCWKAGIYNVIGYPRLTVHDECDHSVVDSSPQSNEAYEFMRHTMATAIPLLVPVKLDSKRGANWGLAD
jgi:DNA polymerase I-like protein with 3'-5' exonuclease and polymerase domains